MATWNTDNPAVGNQITADIADIEENLQELHDVITAITNGTLGTTTAADFQVDAVSTPAIWLDRARFEWKDADEIYIHAGAYHHVGTVSQVVYWNSKLTSDIGSPDVSDWYYLYIDDSAVVTADTNLLTTTELLWSNTAPTWSDAKHGWYSGEDKCIFAVLTDASSNIIEFYHDGGDLVQYNAPQTITETDPTTFATLSIVQMPVFSKKVQLTVRLEYVAGSGQAYIRTTGSSELNSRIVGAIAEASTYSYNTLDIITDTSQRIDLDTSNAMTVTLHVLGWYFSTGI